MTPLKALLVTMSIRYKKGWHLQFKQEGDRAFIFWTFEAPDYTIDGEPCAKWDSRKWYLSEHMTESEIVQTALAAAIMAEEHEAREAFTYKGVRLFNPHIAMKAMMSVSTQLEVRA